MIDFVKLFKDYHIPYSTTVNKGWTNISCPHCYSESGSYHMGFYPDGHCNCWKCGNHDIKGTLSLVLRIPIRDIEEVLKAYRGRLSSDIVIKRKALAQSLTLPTDEFTRTERKYLLKRNYDPDYLHEKYGLVGGGITGRWKGRIIIPIYYNHSLVSWTARSILSADEIKVLKIPRYKNLSIEESVYSPKDLFYNIDNCRNDSVILTEGPFDVMRLGDRKGYSDDVMCSLGTQLTQKQIELIACKFNKVYIVFDNELEAQKKARKFAIQIVSLGIEVEVVDAYSDFGVNDGGDCSYEQVDIIRKELLG